MKPAVSVCIFAYNHENYIGQCIESALMQKTSFNIEIILGEDYSSDKTRIICKHYEEKYPEKIRLLDRGKNLGMCGNVFGTLKEAQGDYIAILDGDDYWTHPLKLQKQFDYLEANKDKNLVFHQTIRINELSKALDLFVTEEKDTYKFDDILDRWLMATGAMFFRREAMDYPDFLSCTHNFDLAIQMIVNRNGNEIGYLKDIMSVYRINSGSNTNNVLYNHENTARRQLLLFSEINSYSNYRYDKQITNKITIINNSLRKRFFKNAYFGLKKNIKMFLKYIGYEIVIIKISK